MSWGILAPDTVITSRRQQNLGLAVAVRHFNDRAVPGLGGMWFPMPVLWSVLAVSIAEELGRPALSVGNAVEALMMRQAIEGPADRRVRGARKMQGLTDWSFRNLTRRGTYVVQPIRMAMVQPLVALSFVQGSRYGAFRIHHAGRQMLELPVMKEYRRLLCAWGRGVEPRGLREVISGLSPTGKVPSEVRKLIQARLIEGDDPNVMRRRNLVALGTGPSAAQLEFAEPLPGIDAAHWTDLRAGGAFIALRDAALAVLDRLEQRLLQLRDDNQPVRLSTEDAMREAAGQIETLSRLAEDKGDRIDAGGERISRAFLAEIRSLPVPQLLQKLAERDGTVIAWRGDRLGLGPAAGDALTIENPDVTSQPLHVDTFAPQLFRLYNLYCLAAELAGRVNPGCSDTRSQEAA
ncbi:hypothetical protein FQV39_04550 [Bosea sp. F3-2]|nr:hypothetical protein FQV39_04550 [Bosea sp. F3-2]